jgi:hypothetical protein
MHLITLPIMDAAIPLTVIPAKAGIHRQYEAWIPAFAGMTVRHDRRLKSCNTCRAWGETA